MKNGENDNRSKKLGLLTLVRKLDQPTERRKKRNEAELLNEQTSCERSELEGINDRKTRRVELIFFTKKQKAYELVKIPIELHIILMINEN